MIFIYVANKFQVITSKSSELEFKSFHKMWWTTQLTIGMLQSYLVLKTRNADKHKFGPLEGCYNHWIASVSQWTCKYLPSDTTEIMVDFHGQFLPHKLSLKLHYASVGCERIQNPSNLAGCQWSLFLKTFHCEIIWPLWAQNCIRRHVDTIWCKIPTRNEHFLQPRAMINPILESFTENL